MNNEVKCPECGFLNEGDNCLNCGAELRIEIPLRQLCPECKTPLTEGKKFCSVCGFNITKRNTVIVETPLQHHPSTVRQPPAVIKKEKSQILMTISIVLLTGIIAGILIFILTKKSGDNALTENRGSKLTECESNLKNLATACEMFATNNEGHYPQSLDELVEKGYIKEIPACPASGKPYIYSFQIKPDFFLIKCGEKNTHVDTGSVSEGYYPVYNPSEGLVLRGNYTTSLQAIPSTVPTEEEKVSPLSVIGPSTWRGTLEDYSLTVVIYEKYSDNTFKGKNKIYWPEEACSSLLEGEVDIDVTVILKEPYKKGNGKFTGTVYQTLDPSGKKTWKMDGKYQYYHSDIAEKYNNGKPYVWILEKVSNTPEM